MLYLSRYLVFYRCPHVLYWRHRQYSAQYKKINWTTTQTPLLRWFGSSISYNRKKQPSSATKDIIRNTKWNVLDFADIELDLATKLSDDDIGAVLSCINAARYLKKLNLVGLKRITGTGLEPLRGSALLQLINFKLLNTVAELTGKTTINERIVLPILDNIMANGNSLKVICLPEAFRLYEGHGCYTPKTVADQEKWSYVEAFKERYLQYLLDRGCKCTKCSLNIIPSPSPPSHEYWEIDDHVCSECLNHGCTDIRGHCEGRVAFCFDCLKSTCALCAPKTVCKDCDPTCQKCRKQMRCDVCGESICEECYANCEHCNRGGCHDCIGLRSCANKECSKEHCGECFQEGTNCDVRYCVNDHSNCLNCRFSLCSMNWNEACRACLGVMEISPLIANKLQEEKDKSDAEKRSLPRRMLGS